MYIKIVNYLLLNIIFQYNIFVKYKVSITNGFINLVQITIICVLLSIIEENKCRTDKKMKILLVAIFMEE